MAALKQKEGTFYSAQEKKEILDLKTTIRILLPLVHDFAIHQQKRLKLATDDLKAHGEYDGKVAKLNRLHRVIKHLPAQEDVLASALKGNEFKAHQKTMKHIEEFMN